MDNVEHIAEQAEAAGVGLLVRIDIILSKVLNLYVPLVVVHCSVVVY